jgi:hypothetical protein
MMMFADRRSFPTSAAVGEPHEDTATQLPGDHGFAHTAGDAAHLEQAFGLGDRAKLTA